MRTRAIARGATVVVVAGVLTGFGVTAAQAATPGAGSGPATVSAAPGTVDAQFSNRFTLHNKLRPGWTMTLVDISGKDEGRPQLGSSMAPGESQAFEVQWLFGYDNAIVATYAIRDASGYPMGAVTVRMELDTWRLPSTSMPDPANSVGRIVDPYGSDPVLTM
ncbi:hypothetical protein [Pseudonocardia sp. N23]|uniref:hypothetical protein n=1 Tax=Pseudonocardia sp. N23 TaxID=1987376 RepID=UPI000BFCB33C|nr:hypothetical protein [Pseudonocardia sp. N23]GAY10285.1 hypothetical protein TOK_4644 [Pseudonocardia sp. N23]